MEKEKQCDIHDIVTSMKFKGAIEKAVEEGQDVSYDEGGGHTYFNEYVAVEEVLKVIEKYLHKPNVIDIVSSHIQL